MRIRPYLFIPVSLFFVLIPALTLDAADIEVDTSAAKANQATLDNAPNGVPIVDIVKPTAQGLSHNKFKNYNVAEQGLILNNSKVVTETQLAGYISYNKNLTGDAAKLILNEVTGTNRSLLKGYTEVAGQAADVIVANPNGISVNGGGFINTPNATLTTGSLLFDGSLLKGFDVSGGDILIEGEGFNTSNIDQVNLYTKALQLNAKLYAKKLAVVTGDNDIALDGTVTPKGTIDTGIAIDSSQLGGIYANTITLVSNDKGVGVNLPPEVYATDSLEISADGNIVMADVSAANNVVVTSESQAITSTSDVVAKNINIDAKTDFHIDEGSILEADDTLEINADKVDNKGKLTAPETNGKVVINAHTEVNNNGHINAENIEVTTATLKNQNEIYSENDVVVTADEIDNRKLIQANDDLDISSNTLTNRIDGVIYAEDNVDVVAETMENDGAVVGKNLDINADDIVNKGALYSKNDMTVRAKTLLNHEMIRSNDEINLLIEKSLTNKKTGVIYSDGAMTIAANDAHDKINTVTNNGLIQSHSTINITAKTLDNITSAPVYKNQTISSTQKISRGGSNDFDTVTTTKKTQVIDIPSDPSLILADSDITIDVETLNNFYSLIASDGDINLLADEANNVGKIIVTTTTTVTKQYRNERYCSIGGPSGSCLHHKHRAGYRGSFTNTQTDKLPVVNYGIQARGSITGNVVNLNNASSVGGVLTDAEVAQKETQITDIKTNSVDLQQSQESLDDSNENAVRALGEVPDMDALIEGIVTEEDLTSFKDDLATLKNSLQLSIDNDKLNIETLSAIIAYSKTLDLTATTAGDLAVLESSLALLKTNLAENEANMESFKTVNDAIVVIEDVATQKEALLDIDTDVRAIITDNTRILDELVAAGAVDTLVGEYEVLSNGLSSEIKTSSDLRASTTKSEITADDGLYQTNSRPSLQPTDDVTYSTNTSSDAFASTLTLPEGTFGLFVVNADSEHPYLIESNPIYTNYATFIGSDYMMSKLDFRPEKTVQRLGDAMYETTLVRDSVMKLSGQRRLGDYATDLEQYKALMDNAIALEESLNLQIGISLTQEQIANLTKDIVWMEEQVIDGHTVLVPVVYLATVDEERMKNGSSIQSGEGLELAATGAVNNQAGLYSGGDMHIAADSITNQGGELSAGGDMALEATTGIDNVSGQLASEGDMTLSADTINLETAQTQKQYDYAQGSQSITATGRQSQVKANGNVTLTAQDGITLKGAQIAAGQDALLVAANGDIQVDTVQAQEEYAFNLNNGYNRGKRVVNTGSEVSANNVTLQSGHDVTLSGSRIAATEDANLNAKGDVNIQAVNDSRYEYSKFTQKETIGSSTTVHESYKEKVKGSAVEAGGDINVTAQKYATQLAGGDSDIRLVGSTLYTEKDVNLSADGDVILKAQQYKDYEYNQTTKKSFGGLNQSNSGNLNDATLLESANTIVARNINVNAGSDIGVVASRVAAGGDVNMQALDEVLIQADNVLQQTQEWSEKSSFLSGGHLMEMSSDSEGLETSTAKGSQISSGGNVDISGGSLAIIGSDVQAGQDTVLKVDTGDIDIRSAQNTSRRTSHHEKTVVSGLTQMLGSLVGIVDPQSVQVEDGQIRVSVGKATYDRVDSQTSTVTQTRSNVIADQNISLNADNDITVEGSRVIADANADQQGDLSLTADNILIKEAKETEQTQTKEVHGKAEASLVVQHQAVEVAKAAKGLQDAVKALKKAKNDYEQYKKQLSSLQGTLDALKADYAAKTPGVSREDIAELQEWISDVKGDEAWYVAGVAAATENVVSKTTLLAQESNAAIQSTSSYAFGFNAGIHLDIDANKQNDESYQVTSVSSALSGQNVTIAAGKDVGQSATVQGSEVYAGDTLSVSGNEVNLLASNDQQSGSSDSESVHIGASVTVFGATSGINLDASYSRNNNESKSQTYNNSVLNADNITITSTQDTNVKGATVQADKQLDMTIGGDLNVASVQNHTSMANHGGSVSGGLSLSGGEAEKHDDGKTGGFITSFDNGGNVQGANGGFSVSNGRSRSRETVLTSITSGGDANITVEGNTDINGATIATVDADGTDAGKLNLQTGTLTYADLSNTRYSQSQNAGITIGLNYGEKKESDSKNTDNGKTSSEGDGKEKGWSTSTSSYDLHNTSGYQKGKTLATVGQGVLRIEDTENSDDTDRLNRDISNSSKELFSVERQQGDLNMTVDHRLLNEDGQNEIAEDLKRNTIAGGVIIDTVTKGSVGVVSDGSDGISSFWSHLGQKEGFFTASKEFVLNKENQQLVDTLNDSTATPEQKQAAFQALSGTISEQFGITPAEALIALVQTTQGTSAKGAYSDGTILINDTAHYRLEDIVNTIGHETQHYLDDAQSSGSHSETYEKNREEYASLMGDATEDYVAFNYENSGQGTFGGWNLQRGTSSSDLVKSNTQISVPLLNNTDADFRLPNSDEQTAIRALAGNNQQREQELKEAACALIHCSAEYAVGSKEYNEMKALEEAGAGNSEAQEVLLKYGFLKVADNLNMAEVVDNLFGYTDRDAQSDQQKAGMAQGIDNVLKGLNETYGTNITKEQLEQGVGIFSGIAAAVGATKGGKYVGMTATEDAAAYKTLKEIGKAADDVVDSGAITDPSKLLPYKKDTAAYANDNRASVVVSEADYIKYYVKKDENNLPIIDSQGNYLLDPEASIPKGKYITFTKDVEGLSNSETKNKLTIESVPGQQGYEQYNGTNVRIDFDIDTPDTVLDIPQKSDYLNDIGGPRALGGARQRVPTQTLPVNNPTVTKLDDVESMDVGEGTVLLPHSNENSDSISKTAGRVQGERVVTKSVTQTSVDDKLAKYLLNKDHPVGGSKAKWFDEALGFGQENVNDLAKQIVFNEKSAVKGALTQYGQKFDQIIPITGANGRVIDVKFSWIRNNDGAVRLVTGIPTKK